MRFPGRRRPRNRVTAWNKADPAWSTVVARSTTRTASGTVQAEATPIPEEFMRATNACLILLLSAAGAGCGDGLTFPELTRAVLDEYCVRGEVGIGETVSGSVGADDCVVRDRLDPSDEGYFVIWRIRVGEATTVIVDADAAFDKVLTVL
jgi:hypothetical protein